MKSLTKALAAVCVALLGASGAQAQSFSCLSNNSGICSSVAPQFSVDIEQVGSRARFTFENSGPIASSITDIYWEASALTSAYSINDSLSGVEFSWGASPNNPGGGAGWNAEFRSDSDSPTSYYGVNPGEWVSFTFNYAGSFANLLNSFTSGSSQIAIHVQSIGRTGGSEWLQTGGSVVTPVPEPSTYALMLAGLSALGFVARRRRLG